MSHQAAALASLFSKARLALKAPSASKSLFRSAVYFDQVLDVEAILTLPSHPLLPIEASSTHEAPFVHPLALSALSVRAQLGQQNIPPYLNALLACLHVNLYTDYVPPPTPSSQAPSRPTDPYEPLSTVQLQFEHLQLLPSHAQPSDPAHAQHAAVRAFSNSWAGNQPPKPHRTLKDSADSSNSPLSTLSSHHAHLTHDGQHWRVHWHCRVPINFIATPFSPLLSITAALTLRLDDALLDQYIPNSSSRSSIRSGFAHSLLAPLHEGPVYPDESPLQSQARANASSALGLDGPNGLGSYLAHLPRDVVGGNNAVVTPRSGAQALSTIQQRRNDALSVDTQHRWQFPKPDSNGDLAVLSPRSASGSILTTSASSHGTSRSSGLSIQSENYSSGLQIYKRSTREVLPLKTGLNVRMRTLVTQHDPFIYRRPSSHQSLAQLECSRLVLSVELENPFESDSTFTVKDIQIKIDPTCANDQQDAHNVVVKALEPMSSVLPIELTRGSQQNLLFYVYVDSHHTLHTQSASSVGGGVDSSTSARNLTITVSAQPRRPLDKQVLADFDSQWNCALDLAPVLSDAAKKSFIASGSRLASTEMNVAVSQGPVAGNKLYSASALRSAVHQLDNRNTYQQAGARRGDRVEDIPTPRPGQLGMGFPPPMRTSSAQDDDEFLQKAKARAASHQSLSTRLNNKETVERQIKPWMGSSSCTLSPSAATRGALIILSTLRRADSPPNTHKPGQFAGTTPELRPTLGEEQVALASVSTDAKVLDPVCIGPPCVAIGAAHDGRGGVSVQTGDTIVVHLTLLHKALPTEAIRNIVFSWSTPCHHRTEPSTRTNRDPIDTDTLLTKTKPFDTHTTPLQPSLSSRQPENRKNLIALQDHLALHEVLSSGQCSKVALALRCLYPGYHTLPWLKISLQVDTGTNQAQELVFLLQSLGAVFVGPAAGL
ncbi:hypothetical protein NDA18_002591 [Ustilago nuda]|nr:hypothetical protein NDA18_002591 [Ustilago nuda]